MPVVLFGGFVNDKLYGQAGDDNLYGGAGDDMLDGGIGNDQLEAGEGNDTLIGGTGNDTLMGGLGNDTFIFNTGDGQDVMTDFVFGTNNNTDKAIFNNLSTNAVTKMTRVGDHLVLSYGLNDQITFNSMYYFAYQSQLKLKTLQFTDGLFSVEELTQLVANRPTATNDAVSLTQNQTAITASTLLTNDKGSGLSVTTVAAKSAQGVTVSLTNGAITYASGSGASAKWASLKAGQTATDSFTYTIKDTANRTSTATVALTITGQNDTVTVNQTIAAQSINAGQALTLNVANAFIDVDQGDVLTWSVGTLPSWLTFNATTKVLSGTAPMLNSAQLTNIQLTAKDTAGTTASQSIALTVRTALINGTANNDTLNGTTSDDWLMGLTGNDVLNGNAGNDRLDGGAGNDTYIIKAGDGNDVIYENDTTAGNLDTLRLQSMSPETLWLMKNGNNLQLRNLVDGTTTTIDNWYAGSARQVERFESVTTATNGQTITRAMINTKVDLLVQAMAQFAPPPMGTTSLPANYQSALNPVVAASWK